MELPYIIKGNQHTDERGQLCFNNDFDLSEIKRIYTIENKSVETIRGWQGHKIEKRWFSAIIGAFKIELRKIDNWDNPSKNNKPYQFELNSEKMDVLYVPEGYISKIQAIKPNAKLLVMADYLIGEVKDEYRYGLDYFG